MRQFAAKKHKSHKEKALHLFAGQTVAVSPCRIPIPGDDAVMTTTVEAIYEHGKLVLSEPLALPEKAHVRVTIESDPEREA